MAQDTMKIVIDEELKRKFKAACAEQSVTMSDVTAALVKGWLEGRYTLEDKPKT
jgi:antitoxin component of RelBE/YafQ-DinJ toxin-antitoxin module